MLTGAINKPEPVTQNRIVKLFRDVLGYTDLGSPEGIPYSGNVKVPKLRNSLTTEEA